MNDVTFRQLEHFLSVAQAGNITAGAAQSHVSQSAMSTSLNGLEKALGTAVFQRSHRGVNLTPAGHALLRKARQLVDDVRELQSTAHELDKELHGPLVVGCYSTLAPSLMPPIITSFLATYPKIDLRFIEGSDDELVEALHQGHCEFVLTYDYRLDRFFPHRALHREDLSAAAPYAVVPTGHPLARSKTIDLADLATEPLILLDLAPAPEYFLQIFDSFGLSPQIRFRTKSHQLIFGLVARGMGISILTQVLTPSGTAPFRDVAVKPLSNNLEPLPIVALSAAGVRRTQRAEAFITHVKDQMGS
ncbi:LysR family transcriptional regulator [Enteractinococcus helveticum]|uniref:HTH lysR-type domain-containing protein n=1 Tax=Enteractinococcus helveticum TaxID=1837282 RepID=A0A1B7M1Z6_9MICC|nr:LysR family transcriptional regulator [Enteractinococcus helveticum]OAV62627.1 hypothetical protein A6F49_05550 [Enteractinococcus helveticum]